MALRDGTRQQLFLVHLTIEGTDLGTWDTWDGGDLGTENTQYRSGGEPFNENLGGGTTISAITITRNYRLSRDRAIVPFLIACNSWGEVVATKQPLDRKYTAFGSPIIAIGVMTGFQDPKVDSNANNPAMIGVILEPNSLVGA